MFDGMGLVTPFDGLGLDEAEAWLDWEDRHGLRARERRAERLDDHIARLWCDLPEQSRKRLGCLAVSAGVGVDVDDHLTLCGALELIAEAEGTLEEEAEFAQTYLSVEWVCSALAELEAAEGVPGSGTKKEKAARRREQTRAAVARHRQRVKEAESAADRKKREKREERMQNTACAR